MHNNLLLMAPDAVDEFLAARHGQEEGAAFARKNDTAPAAVLDSGNSTEKATRGLGYTIDHGVAVVRIEGSLDRKPVFGWLTGARYATGYNEIADAIDRAAADPQARAILLAINSPGGVVAGCKELADHIAQVASQKPMAAYADGLMCSAAFWLGAATGTIYAPRTATVGSIGVVMVHCDYSKVNERAGVRVTYITGGTFKAIGNADGPLTESDRQYLESKISALHAIFRSDVAGHLGLDLAQAGAWGDGQTFVDNEARTLGLVTDTVSGLLEAAQRLGQEVVMDKTQFAAQHPDLLAELEKDAAAAQASSVDAAKIEAAASARADVLGWVEHMAGAEMRTKIETVMQSGVTLEQYKAVAAIMQPAAETAQDDAKAKILAGIEAATTQPLDATAQAAAAADETRAAIDRMATM